MDMKYLVRKDANSSQISIWISCNLHQKVHNCSFFSGIWHQMTPKCIWKYEESERIKARGQKVHTVPLHRHTLQAGLDRARLGTNRKQAMSFTNVRRAAAREGWAGGGLNQERLPGAANALSRSNRNALCNYFFLHLHLFLIRINLLLLLLFYKCSVCSL